MDDFDIEDIGHAQKTYDQKIKIPNSRKIAMIEESIEENDFKNACDLFGEEFLESHISGDQNVDPLKFIPKTYEEFVRLKKSIIQYYQTVPDEGKFDFSLKLITSLLSPLSSYKISEIYSKEKQKGKL